MVTQQRHAAAQPSASRRGLKDGTRIAIRIVSRSNHEPRKPQESPPNEHNGNLQKDPDDWVTGEEPMTAAQASYLKTLSEEAGTEFSSALSKAEASKRIDELQAITGRGAHSA